jgi:hypothetical protein
MMFFHKLRVFCPNERWTGLGGMPSSRASTVPKTVQRSPEKKNSTELTEKHDSL